MKNLVYVIVLPLIFVLISCEKSKNEPEPLVEPAKIIEAVNILNDGSGFSQIYDDAKMLTTATLQQPSLGISDFTLEQNGNLNLVYYSITPLQQSLSFTYFRRTKNLANNLMVLQPKEADTLGAYLRTNKMVFESFRPYTNFFVYSRFEQSSGFGSNNGGFFDGDIKASVTSPNPIGACDLGFRCPVMNSEGGFGYFMLDKNVPTYNMTCSVKKGGVGSQSNLNEYMVSNIHEVYRGKTNPEYFAFGLKKDSLKVFKVTPEVGTSTLVASIQVASLTPGYGCERPLRHYNLDGSVLTLLYKERSSNHFYTFVYNFETNILTKNLNGVELEYSDIGSDIDLDDDGNAYYSGFAGNGSNKSGVSIYKKTGSNPPILIGTDNFIKFGTVEKLKCLMGKVYIVVTGKQTSSSVYQLSVLRQN